MTKEQLGQHALAIQQNLMVYRENHKLSCFELAQVLAALALGLQDHVIEAHLDEVIAAQLTAALAESAVVEGNPDAKAN